MYVPGLWELYCCVCLIVKDTQQYNSHKHGTYIKLPNTFYIFSSLQHYTLYAAITEVKSRAPDDGHISA